MFWHWWALQLPLPIALFFAFRRLAARRPGLAAAVAAPLLVLGLACAFRYVPEEIEAAIFPPWPYVFFQQVWAPLGVFAFVGAVWRWLSTGMLRGLALFLCGFALLFHAYDTKWLLEGSKDDALKTKWDKDGVCLQSSDYSCGAASAVMLARRCGVESSEAEMARLGWTSDHKGTRLLGVVHALAEKLPGRRVRLRRLTLEELRARADPTIVELRFGLFVTHKVLVTRVDDAYVYLDDPLSGREKQGLEWFRSKWHGYAVTVE